MFEEMKLLPCPICGGSGKYTVRGVNIKKYYVKCLYCEMRGPFNAQIEGIDGWEEAREKWNALPRALTWTTEPPKVEGNYWWKCEDESMNEPLVVSVTMYSDGKYSYNFHYGNGPCFHECDKCLWAGPIAMPRKPTA